MRYSCVILICAMMFSLGAAQAGSDITLLKLPPDERETRRLFADCTTRDTTTDNARHECLSDADEATAPENFFFVEAETVVRHLSGGGDLSECPYEFDGYVAVVPMAGITRPTIARLRASATGPQEAGMGRGWASCQGDFVLKRYR
ncbi:MAG: hypothetical protein ACFB0F_13405 [Neomegalonema sp.]